MKPKHIADIVSVSDPAVSPDGQRVAYVVTRTDLEANRYRSAVWVVRSDGATPPYQVTSGSHSDANPAWSPDSQRLVVARESGDEKDKTFSLALLRADSAGDAVTLVERDEAIEAPTWSPDGRAVAFASRVRADRYAVADDERGRPPRRITRLMPRLDGTGWTIDRPTQLFVAPTDGSGDARRITWDDVEYGAPSWAPDSRRVATTAARHEDADLGITNDIWLVDTAARFDPADGGSAPEPQQVTQTDAWYDSVSWEPGGDRIAALRIADGVGHHHSQVVVVAAAGGDVRSLTDSLDRNCAPFPGARAPVWRGEEILFSVEDRGRVPLQQVAVDGSRPAGELVVGDRWTTGYDASGDTVAFTSTRADRPSELFVLTQGVERQVTRHQESYVAIAPPLTPERFEVLAADGTELDAWALLPADFDPTGSYPALLNIHGGPHTQYGERWFDEFQLYASAGYVVLYANPRGSTGYSEASARVLLSPASTQDPGEGWGPPAFDDLMRVVDAAIERYPSIDTSRLGVMGGSYGGYMTTWIIGHTDRFAAACSERAANNLPSLEWSSDAGGSFRFTQGVPLLDAPDEWVRQSPLSYVRDIATPVLILHSDDDLRCPPEQADALWVALRLLKKDVDYYRFPAEGHELTRSGAPMHRIQRVELLLEWFGQRLQGGATSA